MSDVRPTGASLIPCLRYRNAPAMIDWLCEVLGCAKKMVVPGEDGTVAHAELTLGRGMLMVGSATKSENEYAKLIKQPDEIGGCETQSVYVVVADADTVYALAKQRGGTIFMEIKDEDYGGRGFGLRDPEGHLWYVGTYDPWA